MFVADLFDVPIDSTQQGVGKPLGTATMSIETMAKALEYAIEAIVETREEVEISMGITD